MPTSPPAGWYVDPAGSEGQRYWDGANWTEHSRAERPVPPSGLRALAAGLWRRWGAVPVVLRLVLPIVLAVTLGVVGFGFGASGALCSPPCSAWGRRASPARPTSRSRNGFRRQHSRRSDKVGKLFVCHMSKSTSARLARALK